MFNIITECRICGNKNLEKIFDLGSQALTGIFPKDKETKVTKGPLSLVKCHGKSKNVCGLVQLEQTYDQNQMYGENYGYRSGLNKSMVEHLETKVNKIINQYKLKDGDLIVDIGSNDATTLKIFQRYNSKIKLMGIDPTGEKFKSYYTDGIKLIPDFFSSKIFKKHCDQKPSVITSFSMFYDLDNPLEFMKEIYDILDNEGIWVFEQSYMPFMLEKNSFDTICHEHLEFYSLHQIYWMSSKIGFQISDVEFNDINGGSFSVSVTKTKNIIENKKVKEILNYEKKLELYKLQIYKNFQENIIKIRDSLINFVKKANLDNKLVVGLGASTKGNVLLQYCSFTDKDIKYIGEVNHDKHGCYTPGSNIPIIPEDDLLNKKPDYIIVLPWHFRDFFLKNKKFYKFSLVFPLPKIEIIKPRC